MFLLYTLLNDRMLDMVGVAKEMEADRDANEWVDLFPWLNCKGSKAVIRWYMKSYYKCWKCCINIDIFERKDKIDGFEWRY